MSRVQILVNECSHENKTEKQQLEIKKKIEMQVIEMRLILKKKNQDQIINLKF